MAAPTYTTDLSTFELCEGTSGCDEFVNMEDGGTESYQDTDDIIQGSYHISASCSLKVGELQSLGMDAGSAVTIPTDGAIFMWFKFDAGGILDTYDNGGVRAVIGQSYTNWDAWKAGGVDKSPNPAGGWWNYAINPTVRTYEYRGGTGTGTSYQYAGMAIDVTAAGPTKGQPFKIDGFRYGRGSIIFEYGSSGDGYANFSDAAAKNDANDATDGYNRWGLFSAYGGGYLWKGRMQLGTSTNALEMEDENVFILIDDTINCLTNFNTIEVNNASTVVTWTNVIFKALGTQSPGRLVMNNNADMNLDSCQFFDMGAFTFGGSASEFLNCTWNGCGLVTVAGGKLNGSNVLNSTVAADASAIDWDVNVDPDGYLDNLTVSEGTNSHHAIEFGSTCPASMTIRGLDVGSDFASTDAQTNSTFYISDSNTGNSYTINCVGCSGNMTYKSAGAAVTIVNDPVTVKATVTTAAGVAIENARVYVQAKDGTGPFPFEETVTISNSGTTATVTHTGHGMATNDYVQIYGGTVPANEGVFQITLDGVDPTNKYSYTMGSTPGASPTGTITSTFVALYGLTDSNGVKSTSRVYSSDQPITGWARKSSASPYYKEGAISGSVDSADGLTATAVLVADE
jgi:hypothetical protein